MTNHELARLIWDYMHINNPLEPSDMILGLGAHDTSIAERAAELYIQGFAPKILFSGGLGKITKLKGEVPEAEVFAKIAVQAGVPREDILVENQSTNSGENVRFSYRLLQKNGLLPESVILVHKPYMERRALATFEAQWPKPKPSFTATSNQVSFEGYCKLLPEEDIINIMVGDLLRIREYPKLGYQTEQEIPDKVWQAGQKLLARGYTKHQL